MRFFKLLVASALSLTVLAAKKPAASRFDNYHAQALSSAPFEIDDAAYNDLSSTPRDYTVAILLTALDARFGCQLCKLFQPEWETLAKSWIKKDRKGEHKVLFSTLDFANGRNTFQKLQLQTAPVLLLFPPTTGPNASPSSEPIRYDFSGEVTGDMIHGWVTRHLPALEDGKSYPSFVRPINYTRIVVSITILIGLVTFASVAWPYVLPVIQNRNLWAAISLIAVLLFTSGHMFNHIRKVPYVSGNGRGGVSYFAGGFSNQFGMETQIVAAMCQFNLHYHSRTRLTSITDAVLSFATIALALKVPRMKDARTQQVAVIIWGTVIMVMYSFLMNVFRGKNQGYPFWLPPFF